MNSGKDATVVPSEVDSAAPNKAPGRRRKGSAREPRNRSNSATAASDRRARPTGSKQAEDIKKLEISARPTTSVCVSSVEQQGADSLRAEVTTASVHEAQKNPGSHVSSDISIPVGIHVSGATVTEETTATMMTQTLAVAKSEERKLPGGDLRGIEFNSSVPQTKMVSAVEPAPSNDEHMQGTEVNSSEQTKVVSAAESAPSNDEHVQGIEVDSSEQPTKTVSAVESTPSNDEEHTAHEVHLKTADVNMLTSSAATDILQDKIDSSAACQSDAQCTDEIPRQSDASLLDSKARHDASAKCIPGSTKDDDYVFCSEGTGVDVTGSKQDDVKVDTQADDTYRSSSSHLPATSQSTESDQPPDQEEILENRKEQVNMEETLDKSSGDNQTHSQGNETSHDTALVRNCPSEYLNERCSAQVDGDTFKIIENIVELHAAMNIDGPEEALDASSTQSQKEASTTDVGVSTGGGTLETKGTTVETHAAMNTDGPEEAQDALSTQSDKEVSMAEVGVSTDSSTTVCKAHNDLEGQVSCEETLVRAGGDNRTHSNTNDDSNDKNEDTIVNPVDTTREPMEESTINVSENSDLNKQSCTLHFGNDPPASTLATVESNKVTGDAEIVCAGRLESSGIETEIVGIQENAVADLERTKETGDLDDKTSSPRRDDILGTSRSMIGPVCEKAPTEDLTAGSHSEAPSSLVAVEPIQETTVANTVVFMDACNTELDGDSIAEGTKQTVEMVHSAEEQSAVSEHVETQAKPTAICGPMLNESQPAGLEDDCSVLKHGGPTASSDLVVAPNPIGETSAIQVEPEATKSDGYGSASSETIMELEPNKETAVPMQEDIAEANDTSATCKACNDSESHAFGEASMEMHSSEIKAVSFIQSGAGNLSTETTPLPDGTEQTNVASASDLAPENEEHMRGTEVNSSEQQTKMVSPANDGHVQDIMVQSSEQQTKMVSAAEIDTLCVQETAIVDHGGPRGTVDPNDISTHAPALPGSGLLGVEAHSSEQKTASSPGDEVNSSEQQTKINSVAEIETADVKETAIADHEETGDHSGISTHAPLLTESGEKRSPGTDLRGCHMHEVHHTTGDGAILSSSGEQDTLRGNISSGAGVDLPTCQRNDFEGDKDHSTGINVEGIQGPSDFSGKDHFTDPPATTVVMSESDKDTCDGEIVCAGKLESSGGGDIGTTGLQEAVDVADHEGTQGIGIEAHGSEQMKMVSVAQAASNMALVGYSSSEDSMLDDSAQAADGGDFVDSKGAGVDGQETKSTQTTSTLPENTEMDWQSCPLRSGNDSPATTAVTVEPDKDTSDAGTACIGKTESSSGVGVEMMGIQETSIADQQGTKGAGDLNEENGSPRRGDGCGTSCSTLVIVCEKAPSGEGVTVVGHSEVPTSLELVAAQSTQESSISNREEIIVYEKATSGEELTLGSCSDAPTSVELIGAESTQEAISNQKQIIDAVGSMHESNSRASADAAAAARGADLTEEVVKAPEEQPILFQFVDSQSKPADICGPMQEESICIANLENDGSEPKDGSPTASSERVAEPKPIDETSAMQVELATSIGDECAAENHNGVSSETVMESEPAQEIAVPMQEDDKEANDADTACEVCEDLEGHASGDVSMPVESEIFVPRQGDGAEANDTTTINELCKGTESHVSGEVPIPVESSSLKLELPIETDDFQGMNQGMGFDEREMQSTTQPDAVADDLPIIVGAEVLNTKSTPGCANAKSGGADAEQKLLPSSGEATVNISSEPPNQEAKEASSSDPSGNDENAKMEEAAAAQGLLNTEPAHSGENIKLGEADTKVQLPPLSGEEAMVDIFSEPPSHEVEEAPSNDPSRNNEIVKTEKAATAQGLLNTEPAHGGEADTELQLPPSSGEEAMVDICSKLPIQEVKEAPSSDPLGNNENVETENAAAAVPGLLNAEPASGDENAKHGETDTEQQLPPSSGEPMVDISSELPSQEVKKAPSTDPSGNDEDVKMEEAPAAQGLLNTEAAHGGENAKLGEAGMELQLPPSSGEAMVEISSEPLSQEAKEAASTGPSGNDENAKMEEATAAAQVLLNTEPAPSCEPSRLGAGTETQLPLSGEAMVDISSEPPSCQEVKEAPSSGGLGNDGNSKTEKTAGNSKTEKTAAAVQGLLNTEPAPAGENTELGEADTEKQVIPVSAEVVVESSSDLPSKEGKEAPTTDLSGDDEKAKSARAAVVAELFGDATEGGSDQPLPSPRGQSEDADADGGVE